jgi:glycosyltransferase involved in cell wall biosynthesis
MTTFSIITVVRNDMAGAIRTLQSVFAQADADYEVIVQDGASTDGTAEALAGFGDWIDSLVSEPDGGIYDAMNRALARARGEWLLFLNAADWFVDERVLARVAARLRPDDDIFVGQAIRDEDGEVHLYRPNHQFWAGSTGDHQASFIRRELMQELGYDTRYRISGDLHFFTRARQKGVRFRHQDLPIVRKPFSVGASSDFVDRLRDRLEMLEEAFGGDYPVRDLITREMRYNSSITYGIELKSLQDWPLERLLERRERWEAVRKG